MKCIESKNHFFAFKCMPLKVSTTCSLSHRHQVKDITFTTYLLRTYLVPGPRDSVVEGTDTSSAVMEGETSIK